MTSSDPGPTRIDLDGLLQRHPLPEPPDSLHRRVLAAVHAGAPAASVAPSLTERLWFTPAWRRGWAAALLLLAAAQVLMGGLAERRVWQVLAGPSAATADEAQLDALRAAARELGLEPSGSLLLRRRQRRSLDRDPGPGPGRGPAMGELP